MISFWMKSAVFPNDKIYDLVNICNELLLVYDTPNKEAICIHLGDVEIDINLLIKGFKI